MVNGNTAHDSEYLIRIYHQFIEKRNIQFMGCITNLLSSPIFSFISVYQIAISRIRIWLEINKEHSTMKREIKAKERASCTIISRPGQRFIQFR